MARQTAPIHIQTKSQIFNIQNGGRRYYGIGFSISMYLYFHIFLQGESRKTQTLLFSSNF